MSDEIKYDVVQSGSTDLLNQNNQPQVQGAQQVANKQSTTVDYGKGSTSEYKDPSPDSLLGKHVRANEIDHPMGSVKLKHLGAGMRELIQLLQTESHDAPIYGSNTNGSFVKFADGTMIERGKLSFTQGTTFAGFGGYIGLVTFNLVAAFIDNTYVPGAPQSYVPVSWFPNTAGNSYKTISRFSMFMWRPDSVASTALTADWSAIGRWK